MTTKKKSAKTEGKKHIKTTPDKASNQNDFASSQAWERGKSFKCAADESK